MKTPLDQAVDFLIYDMEIREDQAGQPTVCVACEHSFRQRYVDKPYLLCMKYRRMDFTDGEYYYRQCADLNTGKCPEFKRIKPDD